MTLRSQDIEIYNDLMTYVENIRENHSALERVHGKNVIFLFGVTDPVKSSFVKDSSKSFNINSLGG